MSKTVKGWTATNGVAVSPKGMARLVVTTSTGTAHLPANTGYGDYWNSAAVTACDRYLPDGAWWTPGHCELEEAEKSESFERICEVCHEIWKELK